MTASQVLGLLTALADLLTLVMALEGTSDPVKAVIAHKARLEAEKRVKLGAQAEFAARKARKS